ncbi:putative transmembrane protein (PGPGW) [Novipirellula galeiformis]|uniref:Putative transmembrane protein (PGPGW) n=2 Tax=Novipirellula galeiformis TaxID=2528004 RepID=A0A5C6CAG3_9BACT|nr:putative transmembrane protein (PGPGW) [Novipirellula galeiformis]
MQQSGELITEPMFWWVAAASGLVFVASLVAVPWVIIRLPSNYFNHPHRIFLKPNGNKAGFYSLVVLKNLVGAAFLAMGVAMLVLPGQGLLTILIGLSLIEFPGKYRLQQFLISRPFVRRPLNWIRHQAGKPDFEISSPMQ